MCVFITWTAARWKGACTELPDFRIILDKTPVMKCGPSLAMAKKLLILRERGEVWCWLTGIRVYMVLVWVRARVLRNLVENVGSSSALRLLSV